MRLFKVWSVTAAHRCWTGDWQRQQQPWLSSCANIPKGTTCKITQFFIPSSTHSYLLETFITVNFKNSSTLDFGYFYYREEVFRDFSRNSLNPTKSLMKRKLFRMPQNDILAAKADQNLNQQMQLYSKNPESKLLCRSYFPSWIFPTKTDDSLCSS